MERMNRRIERNKIEIIMEIKMEIKMKKGTEKEVEAT